MDAQAWEEEFILATSPAFPRAEEGSSESFLTAIKQLLGGLCSCDERGCFQALRNYFFVPLYNSNETLSLI